MAFGASAPEKIALPAALRGLLMEPKEIFVPLLKVLVPLLLALGLIGGIVRGSLFKLNENERMVVFRFGRLFAVRGPGPVLLVPYLERGSRFNMADSFEAKLVYAYEEQLKNSGGH